MLNRNVADMQIITPKNRRAEKTVLRSSTEKVHNLHNCTGTVWQININKLNRTRKTFQEN